MGLTYGAIKGRYAMMPVGDRDVVCRFRHSTEESVPAKAHRVDPSKSRSAFSQVSLQGSDVPWRVEASQLAENEFEPDDEIIDGDDVWVVKTADLALSGNEWRLITTKQR